MGTWRADRRLRVVSNDDEPITEIGALPVLVPETKRQWKPTPALNLLEKNRQIAIVSADTLIEKTP
jgi:hypothetical protein